MVFPVLVAGLTRVRERTYLRVTVGIDATHDGGPGHALNPNKGRGAWGLCCQTRMQVPRNLFQKCNTKKEPAKLSPREIGSGNEWSRQTKMFLNKINVQVVRTDFASVMELTETNTIYGKNDAFLFAHVRVQSPENADWFLRPPCYYHIASSLESWREYHSLTLRKMAGL